MSRTTTVRQALIALSRCPSDDPVSPEAAAALDAAGLTLGEFDDLCASGTLGLFLDGLDAPAADAGLVVAALTSAAPDADPLPANVRSLNDREPSGPWRHPGRRTTSGSPLALPGTTAAEREALLKTERLKATQRLADSVRRTPPKR